MLELKTKVWIGTVDQKERDITESKVGQIIEEQYWQRKYRNFEFGKVVKQEGRENYILSQ